ncbi:MAG: SDR family NAD(P)-dependent oxidoreductase [Rhodothermales bacterium]|nr:SDR family NAD(P)-dependent oxidoreductase [Rhodothermales bacterium]
MSRLKDKVICITGASAGIGEACAMAFAAAGSRLLLCARRLERLTPVADTIKSTYGVDVHTFSLDVTDPEAVRQAFDGLPAAWTDIDILVNNAGKALGKAAFQEADLEDLDGMLDANVRGLIHVSRAVIPGMIERNAGHVINIGSVAGKWTYPGGTVYCATKAAVAAMTEGMKMDLHGTPIRVSTVDPGLVETEFSLVRFHGDEKAAAKVYDDLTPLTAVDVAEVVAFCAGRPAHVNINQVIMMCTDQSSSTMVHRRSR